MPESREPSRASSPQSGRESGPLDRVSGPESCLHCRAPFGSNDVLTSLSFGFRFAFDVERRRLWIVCGACRRWSRTHVYAPSDALFELERLDRDARRASGTENVRLARHASGVELIRLDHASPAEIAAWRYGDVLRPAPWRRARSLLGETAGRWLAKRRAGLRGMLSATLHLIGGIAVGALSNTALAQAIALGLVLLAFFKLFTQRSAEHERHLRRLTRRSHVVLGRIAGVDGRSFPLHADQAWRIRLVSRTGADRWCLRVPARRSAGAPSAAGHDVDGHEAVRALHLAFPEVSRPGVEPDSVRMATEAIESAGGAESFLAVACEEISRRGLRYATLGELPLVLRLPLEIAVDEIFERSASASALEDEAVESEPKWGAAEASATLRGAR